MGLSSPRRLSLRSQTPIVKWSTASSWPLYCGVWVLVMTINLRGKGVIMQARGDAIAPQACDVQTSKPCEAMVGYMPSANFELAHVASLFSVANVTSLLGPNNIDLSLPNLSQLVLPPLPKPYLIPAQTCGCFGNTRVVTSIKYTVVSGDTLSAIATQYLNLVTYMEIANISSIANPDLILIGQNLTIPIPCSCFDNQSSVNNALSLSYQIQKGDSLSKIAQSYNSSIVQIQALNSQANASDLAAGQVLFLPLPVCKANFSKAAIDANLTVVEGTYELTANGCVQCICNNGILRCVPTPPSFGATCGNMTCSNSSLVLGASRTSLQASGECDVESCVYQGFTSHSSIVASVAVEKDRTCPVAPPPETFYKPPPGLEAAPTGLEAAPPVASPSQPTVPSTSPPPTPLANAPHSAASQLVVLSSFPAWWLYVLMLML